MRRTLFLLLLTLSALVFSGCATITRGTKEALVIESEPSGAQVRLSNGFTGTTPTSFKIPRKGDLSLTITREGYETVNVNLTTQVAGAGAAGMAGNVLVGGIIGVGIDAYSGGMLEHKPNPVKVTLVPVKPVVVPVAPPTDMPKSAAVTAAPPAVQPALLQPEPAPPAMPPSTVVTQALPAAPPAVSPEADKKQVPLPASSAANAEAGGPTKG